MKLAGPKFSTSVGLYACIYHMCNSYIMYSVAMSLYFGQLDGCFEYWYSYYE